MIQTPRGGGQPGSGPTAAAPSSPKKGVLFIQSATVPPLGADIWIHGLIMRHLDRARFEVHAACTPGPAGARTPAFEALSEIPELKLRPINLGRELFGRSWGGKVKALLGIASRVPSLARLAGYIREQRIGILHTSDRPRDALACWVLARLTGIKCVIQVHVEYGAWMSPMLRCALARADALIGVSTFVAASLTENGHAQTKTHAVLNAIHLPSWDPALDGRALREELGLPLDAPVVASIARIFPPKGHAPLIEAIAVVAREVPAVRLLIVGQDYPIGAQHSRELKALAARLGIARNVVFAGQRRDIARVLAASDIYAMASHREPFGLVYAEAMAMKLPGDRRQHRRRARSGGARQEWPAVRRGRRRRAGHQSAPPILIRDPRLRAEMGEYGRRAVEERFSAPRLARDIEAVYDTL